LVSSAAFLAAGAGAASAPVFVAGNAVEGSDDFFSGALEASPFAGAAG
jgi:hypothetical protein